MDLKIKSAERNTGSAAKYLVPLGAAAVAAGALLLRGWREKRSIEGRVALITGGSRGLGLELARKLAGHGCKLILIARDESELARAAAELEARGTSVKTFQCDLSKPDEIARTVDEAMAAFGRIDILINNAGEITVGPIETFQEAEFQRAMDVMFWAGLRMTLAFLPHLTESRDADIVNITSIGGKVAVPHLLPYVAAKFAMTGFSEGLQSELRGRGVHVLTVTPGLMRTGSHLQAEFSGDHDREYRWFALGAAVPGFSMQVSRAADQILDALIARRRRLTLTAAAQAAARIYGAFPETSLKALELVDQWILPDYTGSSASETGTGRATSEKGKKLHARQPATFRVLTHLGFKAAESQNEK